jgi:hypothetical protein
VMQLLENCLQSLAPGIKNDQVGIRVFSSVVIALEMLHPWHWYSYLINLSRLRRLRSDCNSLGPTPKAGLARLFFGFFKSSIEGCS